MHRLGYAVNRKRARAILVIFALILCAHLYLGPGCKFEPANTEAVFAGNSPSLSASGASPGLPVLSVHFIDVGQGDSILVKVRDGKTMLVDGGDTDAGARVVNYLKKQKVRQIDVMVATHPHLDHIGGLIQVLTEFPVKGVYDSGMVHTTRTFERYLTLIDKKNIPFKLARRGQVIDLGSSVRARILSPAEPLPEDANNCSVVMRIEYGNIALLLVGDAEAAAEGEMISSHQPLSAQVLKVGHHGSRTSSATIFLDEVKPEVAIISCGAGNPYGHPHPGTIAALGARGVKIYRTDVNGTIVVETDGKAYRVIPERANDNANGNVNSNAKSGNGNTGKSPVTGDPGAFPGTGAPAPPASPPSLSTEPGAGASPGPGAQPPAPALVARYVASAKSTKFHYPSCKYAKAIKPENLVTFRSREEAIAAGYTPCGFCKP
ncbi:MAG: MBL fold metallo-hydrolase [Firmicutes bacterium]|nr:MBL fold metallo-hydrolase [Bacillota bacterium]